VGRLITLVRKDLRRYRGNKAITQATSKLINLSLHRVQNRVINLLKRESAFH
jgi:hypothetical protein